MPAGRPSRRANLPLLRLKLKAPPPGPPGPRGCQCPPARRAFGHSNAASVMPVASGASGARCGRCQAPNFKLEGPLAAASAIDSASALSAATPAGTGSEPRCHCGRRRPSAQSRDGASSGQENETRSQLASAKHPTASPLRRLSAIAPPPHDPHLIYWALQMTTYLSC